MACNTCNELAAIRAKQLEQDAKLTMLLTGVGTLVGALPPSGFQVDAVTFDGTTDVLDRATLTGVSDSSQMIFSAWVKTTQSSFKLYNGGDGGIEIGLGGSGVYVQAFNSTFTSVVGASASSPAVDNGAWHHWLVVLDTNFAAGAKIAAIYIDGTLATDGGTDASAAFNVLFSGEPNVVGGFDLFNGDVAELYFAPGQFLDFTVAANVQKFRTAGGKPVDLGVAGATPTGTQPAVYLSVLPGNAASVFAANKGTGGDFTITGALAIAGTSPSD